MSFLYVGELQVLFASFLAFLLPLQYIHQPYVNAVISFQKFLLLKVYR